MGIFARDQAEILASTFDVAVIAPAQIGKGQLRQIGSSSRGPRSHPDQVWTRRPIAPAMYRFPRVSEPAYLAAVDRAFRELVRTWGRPDLINAHVVSPAGTAATVLRQKLGIPVLLTEHSSPFSARLDGSYRRQRVRETLESVDRVLAVGEGLEREIHEVADVQVDVTGNVIGPEFFNGRLHAPRDSHDLRLVAVGLLTERKRFDVLLAAFAEAAKSLRTMSLVIVGDGPDRRALEHEAERLGVRDAVRFAGLGTREDIVGWLAWADAIVSSSSHESFGLSIAEALASGLPVLTTASGGPEGFVDADLGMIVPVDDAPSLAKGIERLPSFIRAFKPATARDRMRARFGPELFLRKFTAILDAVDLAVAARD
jgi:glycosyltransferase involved in cell wall biosynthesis